MKAIKSIVFIALAGCLLLTACGGVSSQTDESESTSDMVSFAQTDSQTAGSDATSTTDSVASHKPNSSAASSVSTSSAASSAPISSVASADSRIAKITIPEGYSLSQIGTLLEQNNVCSKAAFLSTVNSYDFTYYPLVAKIKADVNRCYKLEGYLFPNTYEFYRKSDPEDVIGKMLRSAESKIGENYSYTGMTTDEIITLASIIEKEAKGSAEMNRISSVYHNRLKAGMKLQADPTINYIEWYVKPNITGDKDRYSAYYNTYKCAALPVGPICNPGTAALKAACNPAETDYLFFAADAAGKYYYAVTFEEHVNNCRAAGIIAPSSSQSVSQVSSQIISD